MKADISIVRAALLAVCAAILFWVVAYFVTLANDPFHGKTPVRRKVVQEVTSRDALKGNTWRDHFMVLVETSDHKQSWVEVSMDEWEPLGTPIDLPGDITPIR